MKGHYNMNWLIEKFEAGETVKYIYFWGHTNKQQEAVGNFCFSQWYESPFTVDSITYKTAEHWMMARKALLFEDGKNFEKIIQSNTPGEAKMLGRNVLDYDDQRWNEEKFKIVKLGNIHKFNQQPVFADYLLQTGERILVEASPVDTVWGIGLSKDSKDIDNIYAWRGENLLGFALMEARDFLKSFGIFKPLVNPLQSPWNEFPSIEPQDIFWRMGKGEDYIKQFSIYYNGLSERDKTIYRLSYPAPYNQQHFYNT